MQGASRPAVTEAERATEAAAVAAAMSRHAMQSRNPGMIPRAQHPGAAVGGGGFSPSPGAGASGLPPGPGGFVGDGNADMRQPGQSEFHQMAEAFQDARGRRVKEADVIKVGDQPNAIQLRAWKQSLRMEVAAASGRGQEAFEWIRAVEDRRATYETFADSGTFQSLDAKLCAALMNSSRRVGTKGHTTGRQ